MTTKQDPMSVTPTPFSLGRRPNREECTRIELAKCSPFCQLKHPKRGCPQWRPGGAS